MSFATTLGEIRALFAASDNLWYVLTATAVTSLNHPEDIAHVYKLVEKEINDSKIGKAEKEAAKVNAVMRLRDGILKSFIAHGFPKTINGLKHLHLSTPESIRSQLPTSPIRQENSWSDIQQHRARGKDLFGRIYDRHTQRVTQDMHTFYPDLCQTAFHQLYGPILSDTTFLSGMETSLVLVTGLKAQDVGAQLRGHSYGALHQGATQQDLMRIEKLGDMLCRHYGFPLPKAKL
ncbi:hypothetical protein BX666DRAFT_2031171 [Dichotomocladium elegans]|nr:hypothetical protein BX666DRAFT_2031171 [Dichotomocladium elegans]